MNTTSVSLSLLDEALIPLRDNGESCSVTTYSGRGMYGATCAAATFDSHAACYRFMFELGWLVANLERSTSSENDFLLEDMQSMVDSAHSDQMGLGMIVYFPRFVLS